QVLPHPGLLGLIFRRIPPARVSGQADQDASTGLCHEVRSRGADPIPADVLAQPSAEEIQPEQPGQIPAEVSADGLDAGREAHDLRPVLGSGARVAPRRCQLFAELSEELSRPFAARGPACRGAPELHADPVPKRPLLTQTTQHRLVDRYYQGQIAVIPTQLRITGGLFEFRLTVLLNERPVRRSTLIARRQHGLLQRPGP